MIHINEVGPRDGLQNEKATISTDVKVAFVNALAATGVAEIEVTSFVSPKWVPQLADASEVFARIERRQDIVYSALVPNEKGFDRALESKPDLVSVFAATSETFSHKNINTTIDGSFARFAPVLRRAADIHLPVRGYISTAFWCPYEGHMPPQKTAELAQRFFDMGVASVAIGDTIGKAAPDEVRELLDVMLPRFDVAKLSLHFHDTYGRGADNAVAAWKMGIEAFDSSAGGIGGCPYAPGARGNIATEVLVRALQGVGADVHIDFDALARARQIVASSLGRRSDASVLPTPTTN